VPTLTLHAETRSAVMAADTMREVFMCSG